MRPSPARDTRFDHAPPAGIQGGACLIPGLNQASAGAGATMIQGCRCLPESILGSRKSDSRSQEGKPPCPGVPGPDHEPNILGDEGQPRRDNKDRWISLDATTSREEAHPGARASRPHALPLRAAQFPPIRRLATLPAGTAWAAPKQSPGAGAGRPGWRRWPRLCQDVCGRDARAPGWCRPDGALEDIRRAASWKTDLPVFRCRPETPRG